MLHEWPQIFLCKCKNATGVNRVGGNRTMAEGKEEESKNQRAEPAQQSFLGNDGNTNIEDDFERKRKEAVERRRRMMEEKEEEEEEEEEVVTIEEKYDFPKDPEGWTEEDLQEIWTDAPPEITKGIGWDPDLATDEDWELIESLRKEGKDVTVEPFYVPYRKYYPDIPDNHFDIRTPKAVVEELDRYEEFLRWFSFVFKDGTTYEGTVWDDLAHGKGVLTTPMELCRYEGEWFRNAMQGHGVLEVNVPEVEPPPNSELANKMRAQGKILKSEFLSPEDKDWLVMDIEDTEQRYNYRHRVAFEDSDKWIKYFGQKPEKGLYRYAGQWKHSRMHGCGVYEVNRRQISGKFYFGELLTNKGECTEKISAMHAALAEVAAAKARMFVNKPDGMVREMKGPYTDPQHPYMYEEEDLWMAPGFINEFYEVPKLWKKYVNDVDQERQMWLNSFIKSPLRIPMPAELEYWWSKDPEFVLLGNTPEPDPKNPSKLKEPTDEILLHVPTGKLINWTTDEEGRVRLFMQPFRTDGEVRPEEAVFLPLGFDEFMGKSEAAPRKKESEEERLKRVWEEEDKRRQEKWEKEDEERRKKWEAEKQRVELELKYIEAQEKLEDVMDSIEYQLRIKQINEEAMEHKTLKKESKDTTPRSEDSGGSPAQGDEDVEEGEEEEDADKKPRSFGTVALAEFQESQTNSDNKTNKNEIPSSPFPTSFASLSMLPWVALQQLNPLALLQPSRQNMPYSIVCPAMKFPDAVPQGTTNSTIVSVKSYARCINFPVSGNKVMRLKAGMANQKPLCRTKSSLQFKELVSLACVLSDSCFVSHKSKSFGFHKKKQDNQRTKQIRTITDISNKLLPVAHGGILSLSMPMEYLSF